MNMNKVFLLIFTLFVSVVHAQANRPPGAPTVYGPTQWFINSTTTFSAVAYDPDSATTSEAVSSQIRYLWDWEGDGIVDATSSFVNSGKSFEIQRSFISTSDYTIKVKAEDALGAASTWANFKVIITTINRPPVLELIGNKEINEGQELSFSVFGTDPDSDIIIYSSSVLPKGASFTKAAGVAKGYLFRWTPSSEQYGSYPVTFLIEDGRGGSDSEAITISVKNVDIEASKDTVAPTIMSFVALPTKDSAIVKWSSDEKAVGKVEYGTKESLGSSTSFTSDSAYNGEQTITSLKPSILYFYKITVKDAAGNEKITGIQTFVTTSLEVVAKGERQGKIDSGAAIRIKGKSEVYQVIRGKLRHVPSPTAFSALGFKWDQVIEIEASEATYPRFTLARSADDRRIYYITQSGLKKWIRNIDLFNSYGNKWEDVAVVAEKDLDIYQDVDLIKLSGDDKVYKLEGDTKRWIKDAETFNKLGYDWNKVHPVNATEFSFYKEI